MNHILAVTGLIGGIIVAIVFFLPYRREALSTAPGWLLALSYACFIAGAQDEWFEGGTFGLPALIVGLIAAIVAGVLICRRNSRVRGDCEDVRHS